MRKKKLLIVATSTDEYNRLDKSGVLDCLTDLFNADYYAQCNNLDCFKNQSTYAYAVLYSDTFSAQYPEVFKYAAASWTINKLVRILHKGGKTLVKGSYKSKVIEGDDPEELKEALEYVIDKNEITGESVQPLIAVVAIALVVFAFMFGAFKTHANTIPVVKEPVVIEAQK